MLNAREIMELQKLSGMEKFSKLTVKQMLDREKLIELMRSFENKHNSIVPDKHGLAEFLIANDVVPVVRCKDCKEWLRNRGVVDSPNGHCFYHETHTNGHDFCSYGERKDNG